MKCEHKRVKEGCYPITICLDCGKWIEIAP